MTPTINPTRGDQGATAGATATSPPGWHRDPLQRFPLRYWDGHRWTENVVNAERQVGVDVGWARAAAAALGETRTVSPATTADAAQPVASAGAAHPAEADAGRGSLEPEPAVEQEPEPEPAVEPTPVPAPEPPVERFDISPDAVLGRRAARPAAATPPTDAVAGGAPRPAGPTGAETEDEPSGPSAARRALTALGRVPGLVTSGWVATGFALVAVVAVVAMGLSWASSSRSYEAQEAWQERAEVWEERAGEHADERDEAIAQVGQTRQRNRTLTEDIAELEDQIEGLAADNASLHDENRLLRDALADLGYRLAP